MFAKNCAKYYDAATKTKPYKQESLAVAKIIDSEYVLRNLGKKLIGLKGKDVLDVACGTGNHAYYLADWFNVYVQDASKDMYDICQKKLGEKVHYLGVQRMESFHHRRKFDAIVSLFSAIDYVADLEKTLSNFYKHLRKDGVVIFDFWNKEVVENIYTKFSGRWCEGVLRVTEMRLDKENQLAYSTIRIGNKDFIETEEHILKYYSIAQMMKAMQQTGFKDLRAMPLTKDLWNITMIGKK